MKTINLHGNEYATYEAVLNEAHKKGLVSIKTELISLPSSENNYLCVFKAIVTMKDERVFEGIGDATPKNVSSNIVPHIIRMAETRAKGRALRDAVNIGKALAEEFGDDLKTSKSKKVNKSECKHKNQVSRKSNSEKNKDRINMRPTDIDTQIDNSFKQIFGYIAGQRPVAGATRAIRQMIYRGTLGLNPSSALKNISQGANTYAKLGEIVHLACDMCTEDLTPGEIKYNAHPARRETKTLCYQCSKSLLAKAKKKARTLKI